MAEAPFPGLLSSYVLPDGVSVAFAPPHEAGVDDEDADPLLQATAMEATRTKDATASVRFIHGDLQ